jgi:hypothetical protein
MKPKIENAPGLVLRPRKEGWVAYWQARSDLVNDGYSPQTARLWAGAEPTEAEAEHIAAQCRRLQSDMLMFSRQGGFVVADKQVETLRELVNKYQTDPSSSHLKKRYHVRKNHDSTLRRIVAARGDTPLAEIKAKTILLWYDDWSGGGEKLSMGHSFMAMLRTMFGFGAMMLESPDCERLSAVMHHMRFKSHGAREEALTADQAVAIRNKAREIGWFSIALGQALQFDLILRQKDVIGEWVPMSAPGVSDFTARKGKWLRGLKWSEIDKDLVLRHITSKKEKPLVIDLNLAPMVQEELAFVKAHQGELPKKGPMVICEATCLPWVAGEYRRKWRMVARLCGVPDNVFNMDSRAGAISEASEAGAELEHIKHAATHSNIAMTERYSRLGTKKVANVQRIRLEHRNKPKTD